MKWDAKNCLILLRVLFDNSRSLYKLSRQISLLSEVKWSKSMTKVFYMRDILKTLHIRVRVVYGGQRLRTKSTSWVLVSFAHEFQFLSPCYFDVEGRNSSSNFPLMA